MDHWENSESAIEGLVVTDRVTDKKLNNEKTVPIAVSKLAMNISPGVESGEERT